MHLYIHPLLKLPSLLMFLVTNQGEEGVERGGGRGWLKQNMLCPARLSICMYGRDV